MRLDDAVAAAFVGPGLSGKDEIAHYRAKLDELSPEPITLERPGARAPDFDPNMFVVLGEEVPMPVSEGETVRVEQGMTEPNTWRVEKETTG